jgi:tetratricopeptide (TPR) repeat protein
MGGYPPAVTWAVELAKAYGIDTLLADRQILDDFTVRVFTPILRQLGLDDHEWAILRVLSGSQALPLYAIAAILDLQVEEAATAIRRLVDLNLVSAHQSVLEVSPPIREAVQRVKGALTRQDYTGIAQRLRSLYWMDESSLPNLRIVDATIHALARAGSRDLMKFRDLTLPSMLFRAAKESYDTRPPDLVGGERLVRRAIALDPNLHAARSLHFKILVRQEKWQRADATLEEIARRGLREQFYLRGFLEWKRGRMQEAVEAYKSALKVGHASPAVYREYAHCLLRLGRLDEAEAVIRRALERYPRDRFLIDVAAQIAIERVDYPRAEELLRRLERMDSSSNYHHRLSTLLAKKRDWPAALYHAEQACDSDYVRFEWIGNKIDVLIESHDFSGAANALEGLKGPRDVLLGLRCKLAIHEGKIGEAQYHWSRIARRDDPVHRALRVRILNMKLEDTHLTLQERNAVEEELARLGHPVEAGFAVYEDVDDSS